MPTSLGPINIIISRVTSKYRRIGVLARVSLMRQFSSNILANSYIFCCFLTSPQPLIKRSALQPAVQTDTQTYPHRKQHLFPTDNKNHNFSPVEQGRIESNRYLYCQDDSSPEDTRMAPNGWPQDQNPAQRHPKTLQCLLWKSFEEGLQWRKTKLARLRQDLQIK